MSALTTSIATAGGNLSDEEDHISEAIEDVDLPAEFFTFGRQIVQEMCLMKENDKQLLPNYFSRSRFRSLSTLHKKRCVEAWNNLTDKQREDIKTKLKIPANLVKPVLKPPAVLLATAQHKLTTTANDDEDSSDDDEDDVVYAQSHGSGLQQNDKVFLPEEIRRYGREIIRELCTLKGPDHQPLLPHSYARTKFRSLRDGQKKKVVDVWQRLLSANQRSQIMAKIQIPLAYNTPISLNNALGGLGSTLGEADDDDSEDGADHVTEVMRMERNVVNVGNSSSNNNNNKEKDSHDAIRRRLNELTAAALAVPENELNEVSLEEEDSEAEFAIKVLNCPLAPADLKEIAIKQLRAIQKMKIRRRNESEK
jgi:hypothetical protein